MELPLDLYCGMEPLRHALAALEADDDNRYTADEYAGMN
jgi:hypothetical protein